MSSFLEKLAQSDLFAWASSEDLEAFRLYNSSDSEAPCFIDVYGSELVVNALGDLPFNAEQLAAALRPCLGSLPKVHWKLRRKTTPQSHYQKLNDQKARFRVREGSLTFEVNLTDYMDTGLFLDHRPLRRWLLSNCKSLRVLNLFCYTGSLSVAAAKGGAFVTSLDMNKNYLEWAQDNFRANNLDPLKHRFFRRDALQYLEGPVVDQYDLILLDPPSFSQSEKMKSDLSVPRDQMPLIRSCVARLREKGLLMFSTNKKNFILDPEVSREFNVIDKTNDSIPKDFRPGTPHYLFEITKRKSSL